jgi:hypothetical protein
MHPFVILLRGRLLDLFTGRCACWAGIPFAEGLWVLISKDSRARMNISLPVSQMQKCDSQGKCRLANLYLSF